MSKTSQTKTPKKHTQKNQNTKKHTPPDYQLDRAAITALLDGRWAAERQASRKLAGDPRLQRDNSLGMDEHRERVLEQLKILVEEDAVHRAFPTRFGGQDNHGGNLAAFEELICADPSIQIKAGVQWGLFASAILHLGSQEHHDAWLPGALSLETPGAFAMTEIGHGSDVASLGTTATYDPEADEFVIHTPFRAAWKEYLGNAALHGKAAVVFAQLIVGKVNHGVHALYVPIRDEAGELLPGVSSEDDREKGGLNGIDNGRLAFDNVRVPRTNLLNRYGDVDADGVYSSPIPSPGRRFFTMLSTLVQGRVSLDGAAVVASKLALQTAITYGNQRRQFTGADENEETVLLDYQHHQRRLLPRLAQTYAANFAHNQLLEKFHEVFSGAADTDADRQDLETLAAGMKAITTWHALDTLQECREACGGAGYMAENRLVGLRADMDVYVTFEGDNTVLLQLVAKRLLADYADEFKNIDTPGIARFVAEKAADMAWHRTGLRRVAQRFADVGSDRRSAGTIRSEQLQRELLEDRVDELVSTVGAALRNMHKLPADEAAELFNSHQSQLIHAARAHAELVQWEAFTEALSHLEDKQTRRLLTRLRDLFGLTLIERDLAWYLMNGRLSAQRARVVTSYINRLFVHLRPFAGQLVDAFGYGDDQLRATIATGVEAQRQEEAREYYRKQRASGHAPVPEKRLR